MDVNPYAAPHDDAANVAGPPPVSKSLARLGAASLLLAVLSSVWLLIAAAHVRSDRTYRIPEVTSEGPFAGYVTTIVLTALGMSVVAGILAQFVAQRAGRWFFILSLTLLLAIGNFLITAIINAALYED
jgi:hypothetical protein